MAGQISTKTFHGGMNKDIDVSLLKQDQYRHAENYKLIADEDSNGFILENAEGNAIWLYTGNISGFSGELVGHCFIKPYLVLFFTTNNQDANPSGGVSEIGRVLLDGDNIVDSTLIYLDGFGRGNLTFSQTYPINAVGYYEAPDNIKVYWSDGYNPVRMINIMDPLLSTYKAGMLDIVPDFPISTSVDIRPEIASLLVPGNLESCSVQYAYQYFLKEGVQTLWSPASKIQIIPKNNTITSFGDYEGGEVDEDTAYGVKVSINIPSENLYTHMRVVAIQYNTYNAVPLIRVLNEYTLDRETTYTLDFVDSGQSLSELTYEEFAVSSNAEYRAKDLAIKDNRLFLANIDETFYDVDIDYRAYRHNSLGVARIYEANLSDYLEVSTPAQYASVPDNHDCINKYNDPNNEISSVYKYQADGTTLGAEGTYVKINFTNVGYQLDTLGVDSTISTTNNITISQTSSYLHNAGNRTYHRQEVYRLGIVLRNTKMQAAPVKWLCDVKTPTYSDFDMIGELQSPYYHLYVIGGTDNTYANMLGIEVELSDFSETGASSWEVVMVPRESADRSILGQGLLQPTISYSGGSYYGPVHEMETENPATSATYNAVSMFISPEVAFNKNLEYRTGDWYQKVGYFDFGASNELNETGAYEFYHYKVYDFTADDGSYSANWRWSINSGQIITYDTSENSRYSLDAETVTPYNQDGGGDAGISSTFFAADHVIAAGIYFMDPSAAGSDKVAVVNYRRNIFASQYGGPSYLERQLNTYVPISDPSTASGTNTCYEGDTYIDFFWHQKQSQDLEDSIGDGVTNGSTFLFPVESSISPRLSHSDYIYRQLSSHRHRLMQEIAGTHEGEVNSNPYVLEQKKPLYEYNPVYSQLPRATIFIADNDDFETTGKFPVRIVNSEHKTNNEELDSFTQFRPNNFIDLDGSKGQIQNIKTFKNRLFYWQDTGFGVASVNRQSLIQDNNPGVLALGTGGILDRFDYISDHIGNQNQFGIVLSRKSIYWFDNNKGEFFKYGDEVNSISKIKGIQTWLNEQGHVGDVQAVYDEKYNDVIFTLNFSRLATITDESVFGGGYITEFELDYVSPGIDDLANVTCRVANDSDVFRPDRHTTTKTGDNTFTIANPPHGEIDGEFYITFDTDTYNKYTLTYNEQVGKFVCYNSFTPMSYIQTDSAYYSTDDTSILYQHNDKDAERCSYYGTVYDSIITTSFNDHYQYTKVWDALKWVSESVDSDNVSQYADTFQNLEMYDDYQNTGDRALVVNTTPTVGETEVTRRERTWSMFIPRNIVDVDVSSNPDVHDVANHDETQTFKERMRDKYLTCKFTYDNDDGYVFSIPLISTVFRKSVR